jgi:prolyl oligopeptidase
VAAWTAAQDAYTRGILDHLPGRKELEAKLLPLMQVGSVRAPIMRGNRYFYLQREGDQNQPVLYLREGYKGAPRALLDPAKLDPSGLTTISGVTPSEDGKLVAYETFRSGDERSTLRVLDVDRGVALPLAIGNKAEDVS